MAIKKSRNRIFQYKRSYAPIWSLLTDREKQQVLFERAANYMIFREAHLFVNSGNYGRLTEVVDEPTELLEDEEVAVEPFSPDAVPVPVPDDIESPERARKIYNAIAANPHSSLADLVKEVEIEGKQVGAFLRLLREAGVIRICGKKKHASNNKPGFVYEVMRVPPQRHMTNSR